MVDSAKKRVQFGERILFYWPEDSAKYENNFTTVKWEPKTVMSSLKNNGGPKQRRQDGARAYNFCSVSGGRKSRPSTAQPIRNSVTSPHQKRPASAWIGTHNVSAKPLGNSLSPVFSTSGSSVRPRSGINVLNRPLSRCLPERPKSCTANNGSVGRVLPERPVDRAINDRPHSRAFTERPITRTLTDGPISRSLRDKPISRNLPDRPVSRALTNRPISDVVYETTLQNGHAQEARSSTGYSFGTSLWFHDPGPQSPVAAVHASSSSTKMASEEKDSERLGLTAWGLRKRKLWVLEESEHGFFHEGDCYVLLWADPRRTSRRTLHCWFGQSASQKDRERIEKKALQMVRTVGKISVFSLETQGCESPCFLRLFPEGICYVEGRSSPVVSMATSYCKRLYHITGRKYPKAQCLHPSHHTLDPQSCYLLDGNPRMYLWIGSKCDYATRVKALILCRRIRDLQRHGRARIVIVEENDAKSHDLLMRKLKNVNGEWQPISRPTCVESHGEQQVGNTTNETILYRLTEGSGLDGMSEVARTPLRCEFLSAEDSFMLDFGPRRPVVVWCGNRAVRDDFTDVLSTAKLFKAHHGYSRSEPILCIRQGEEPSFFKRVFITWRQNCTRGDNPVVKSYTAGSIELNVKAHRIQWKHGPDKSLNEQISEILAIAKCLLCGLLQLDVINLTEQKQYRVSPEDETIINEKALYIGPNAAWSSVRHTQLRLSARNPQICMTSVLCANMPQLKGTILHLLKHARTVEAAMMLLGMLGKTLFSRRDNRSVAQTRVAWPEDSLHGDQGVLEVWRLEGGSLKLVPQDEHGIFYDGQCYLVVHRPAEVDRPPVIYYWMGCRTSSEERESALSVACEMDVKMNRKSVLIRVLDGKEPSHFLELLSRTIMVYIGQQCGQRREITLTDMFTVEEVLSQSIRVTQVPVKSSHLCSKKSVVLLTPACCYLWYGKNSGGYERDYTKTLLGYLWPDRMYSFQIEMEGKESLAFWGAIGGCGAYQRSTTEKSLSRRDPVLVQYFPDHECFEEIPDFTQEDLAEDGVFVLDFFDQVMVWSGDQVKEDFQNNTSKIARLYMTTDPAGRSEDDVQIWLIKQNYEPEVFLRHFRVWDTSLNMSDVRVDQILRLVRQENTVLDFDQEITSVVLSPLGRETYKTLVEGGDREGWDNAHKERHLSNEDFQKRLGVSRTDFYRFPTWKQRQIRNASRLA